MPWSPDFSWVAPDLAVGGAFPIERAAELASAHGVGAVVDLRDEGCDDRGALQSCGIDYFLHLPTPDLEGVSQAMLDDGVAFSRACARSGRRLLIHCAHGIGRSATLALCVLVDRGSPPLEALRLAKDARSLVSPSLAQYKAWAAWVERWGLGPAPTYEAFGLIAYRHLAETTGA